MSYDTTLHGNKIQTCRNENNAVSLFITNVVYAAMETKSHLVSMAAETPVAKYGNIAFPNAPLERHFYSQT